MRRSRRLKVSANGAADSIQRPLEIDLILREKGKIFLALVFSLLATYIILVQGQGLEAFWLDLATFDWARGLATLFVLVTLNLVALSYLVIVFPDVVRTTRRILLVGVLCLLVLLLTRGFSVFNTPTGLNLLLFVPLGFATLVFAIVYHRRFAVIAAGYLALLVGLALHFYRGAPGADPSQVLANLGPVPILLVHLLSAVGRSILPSAMASNRRASAVNFLLT